MNVPVIVDSTVAVTREIFNTMVLLKLENGAPYEAGAGDEKFDFTGIIGLSGAAAGAVGVRFKKGLACKVASQLLGMAITSESSEARDTVGEMTNMIAGGLKNELDKAGIEFDISVPTVIAGDQHTFSVMGGAEAISIPFQSDGETFVVEVCFKKK